MSKWKTQKLLTISHNEPCRCLASVTQSQAEASDTFSLRLVMYRGQRQLCSTERSRLRLSDLAYHGSDTSHSGSDIHLRQFYTVDLFPQPWCGWSSVCMLWWSLLGTRSDNEERPECCHWNRNNAYGRFHLDPEIRPYWIFVCRGKILCWYQTHESDCNHHYTEAKHRTDTEFLPSIEMNFAQ